MTHRHVNGPFQDAVCSAAANAIADAVDKALADTAARFNVKREELDYWLAWAASRPRQPKARGGAA